MNLKQKFDANYLNNLVDASKKDLEKYNSLKVGDQVRVKIAIEEKGKKLIQTSEGLCIEKIDKGLTSTFTIRRMEKNYEVLMTFSFFMQNLELEVLGSFRVRRAKLFYLIGRSAKASRLKALRPMKKVGA